MIKCSKCKECYPETDYARDRRSRTGRVSSCKQCRYKYVKQYKAAHPQRALASSRSWKAKNKNSIRFGDIKRKYGLAPDRYSAILQNQSFACAICAQASALCVDHCHDTGSVRGLLCDRCNRGLGAFKDDIKLLEAAVEYLGKPAAEVIGAVMDAHPLAGGAGG